MVLLITVNPDPYPLTMPPAFPVLFPLEMVRPEMVALVADELTVKTGKSLLEPPPATVTRLASE
jgi:hypothetical protein